jgi:hypothetical protein
MRVPVLGIKIVSNSGGPVDKATVLSPVNKYKHPRLLVPPFELYHLLLSGLFCALFELIV